MTEEKKKEQTSAKTDVTLAEKKAAKKAAKKRKKFEKKELKRLKKEYERRAAILPAAKRPIICPPRLLGFVEQARHNRYDTACIRAVYCSCRFDNVRHRSLWL